MYHFIALWVRLIALLILAGVLTAVVLFLGRKKFTKWEKILSVCLALLLVILGGGSTLKSLIRPEVNTIVGTYEGALSAKGPSPFQWEYCFLSENEKVYLDIDSISKNAIFKGDLIRGQEYTISYEEESHLIVAITKNH